MLGPHTHRDNPLSRIMCAPIGPPVTVIVLPYQNSITFLFFWNFFSIFFHRPLFRHGFCEKTIVFVSSPKWRRGMTKRIRVRVEKAKGTGMPRIMRVEIFEWHVYVRAWRMCGWEVHGYEVNCDTWLGTGNVHREFPVSSVHVCVQSVLKNIREDMEDRWVTNLSEDRKRFYLVSSPLDPHTKMLSFCDNKYFPS
jgi:hypothetical protein